MIIGITGGIGSGKTMVSRYFGKHGYKVIDADRIGHIVLKQKSIRSKLIKVFGASDRKALGAIAFRDQSKLKALSRIVWPKISKELKKQVREYKPKGGCIIDAAVLIESGWYKFVDVVIVIKASRKNQIKRLIKRNKFSMPMIKNIIKSQLKAKQREKFADFIITNDGSEKSALSQARIIIRAISRIMAKELIQK